ncbi:MAG: peptidylprolyl isomerase [Gammaproteobacteria bacterium]|nr:peptidylprolyl isomerase [Gammaproteobacteria bacterium]
MEDAVADGKYVELMYKVIDQKSGDVLTEIEFPLGYVHGVNEVLAPTVTAELEGRRVGDVIEVPIDCNQLYGPRDESLVVIEQLENVPEDYREVGMSILMENDSGQTKSFLVTRVDEKSITFDGNNPLCGREVIFRLDIKEVRDATEEEIEFGGKVEDDAPDVTGTVKVPLQ